MDFKKFEQIPGYDTWVSIEKLTKGWSVDTKYVVVDKDGNKFLLRITSMDLYEKKAKQFKVLREVEKLGLNASKPVCFGQLNETELYTVLTWHINLKYNILEKCVCEREKEIDYLKF